MKTYTNTLQTPLLIAKGTPRMGRLRAELSPGLRGFLLGNYLIFYRQSSMGIEVVRVLHGVRDIKALFYDAEAGTGTS